MRHILSECAAPGQAIIWEVAKQIWTNKGQPWPGNHFGILMGCATIDFEGNDDQLEPKKRAETAGINRLFRMLISEAMRQIWVIRCARVIGGHEISDREVYNKWKYRINQVLKVDRQRCNKYLFKDEAQSKGLVLSTW
ncbi:hypothetical protein FISHEDRAFT_11530, partial [Fistulina hepatica ATCC 64428]